MPSAMSSTMDRSSYSDKQVAPSIDHGPEVVPASHFRAQPFPDAYAYTSPSSANNDTSNRVTGGESSNSSVVDGSNETKMPAWAEQETKSKKRICGLSRRNFVLVVAVLTALVVAAIIGGSVGGALAGKSKDDSNSVSSLEPLNAAQTSSITAEGTTAATTATATTAPAVTTTEAVTASTDTSSSVTTSTSTTSTTSSSSSPSATSGEGTYNCPSGNNKVYKSSLSGTESFTILCDADFGAGTAGVNGGTVTDLTAVVAYSIDSCIDQCVAYNIAGGTCGAVAYGANVTLALSRGGIQGNCFLKSEAATTPGVDNSGQAEAAYLNST